MGTLEGCKKIEKVFSKDQALEQCARYLCKEYPLAKTIAAASTSEAVKLVAEGQMKDSAVIAQKQVLKKAGFRIIEENLCPKNKTRFVILSKNLQTKSTGDDKTLLSIHPPMQDKPGVLYNSLGFFCNFGINLEDIKSRPDGKSGYYFYIELDGHKEDEAVELALKSIKFYLDPANAHPRTIKVLGSYKNTHWKD
jgi:prephenate dehydratase